MPTSPCRWRGCAQARRGAEAGDHPSAHAAARPGGAGRTDGAWRSGVGPAVDLLEHAHPGHGSSEQATREVPVDGVLGEITTEILRRKRFLLTSHARPDGDPLRRSVMPSATRWSPSCCTASATACKATSRLAKAGNTPIGMRSFAPSRGRSGPPSAGSSRRSRSTPRRRNWWGPSRMAAERGGRPRRRNVSACTTSSFPGRRVARPSPTAFTICIG
jgi:hypothetical protein